MSNFDLKKFLIENKLTNNSKSLTELVNTFEIPGQGSGVEFLDKTSINNLFFKYSDDNEVIDYVGFIKALEEYKEAIEDYIATYLRTN